MLMTDETTLNLPQSAEPIEVEVQPAAIKIPLEVFAYLALILLSLALRLPGLGIPPLADAQAHEALTAYRAVIPNTDPRPEGSQLVARNPLMFTANALVMMVAGGGNTAPLIATALLGTLLVLLPLLFRRWLGSANSLIIAALFATSPILLIGSRFMGGAVWSAALVLLGLYCAGRFAENRVSGYGIAATVFFALLVLMSEPAGFIMFVGVVVGLIYALMTNPTNDEDQQRLPRAFMRMIQQWPILRGIAVSAVTIGLLAAVFLLYPRGLSSIGELLSQAVRGFYDRPAFAPFAFPLLNSLLYEPVLWVFGIVGIAQTARKDDATLVAFMRRVMIGWLIVSVVASFLYQNATAFHALWFTIPLAGLSAAAIERILTPVYDRFWNVPVWGPFVHAAAVVAIIAIAGINIVIVGRAIMNTTPDLMPTIEQPIRLVYVVLAAMLMIITFFLVGSIWGTRATWNGVGIGILIFLGLYSLGAGWRAAITAPNDARELWRTQTAADNLDLMVSTLKLASTRSTSAPYSMPIVVVKSQTGLADDNAFAWAIRRFTHVKYVNELPATATDPAIIMRREMGKPQVSAQYVGQDFPIYNTWYSASLGWDLLAWLYDRDSRVKVQGTNYLVVWVRSDIYGLSQDEANPANAAPIVPAQP
jgi:hypothetical protein